MLNDSYKEVNTGNILFVRVFERVRVNSLFGFCGCSGKFNVRFLDVCSGLFCGKIVGKYVSKFVEKLWESFTQVSGKVVLHIKMWAPRGFAHVCGKVLQGISTGFDLCYSGSFAQFPHSLLLQLLFIREFFGV